MDKEFKETLAYFWQAKASQIYRELYAMEEYGWLVSERVAQEDKPNKRVYTITGQGKSELLNWLSSPEADIENATRVKSVFFMRLFFAGETSREQALELLYLYREQCLASLQEMDNVYESYNQVDPIYSSETVQYWKLVALNGEIMRKARLEWVEQAINILKSNNEVVFGEKQN
ncbi:MAG: PadR family transcriptional regulator [Defluviitaleaceae bacterium]|nr:PadR family transcriptional regulator [Defluviitaleaceae bacterium]